MFNLILQPTNKNCLFQGGAFFMSGNRKVSSKEKLQAVYEYLGGKGSLKTIAQKYCVGYTSFRQWIQKYRAFGESAFIKTGHNASYSVEFKQMVIEVYLSGKGSFEDLAVKYKIPSSATVRQWVLRYNGYKELKASGTGGSSLMTKGRKTTFEERIEIAQYCIAHNHNYAETAEKYKVSYQQARSYTVKCEASGIEALKDNRGRRKNPDELSELERLRAELKILKAQKERAEMEVSFLKKLEEIERRRG